MSNSIAQRFVPTFKVFALRRDPVGDERLGVVGEAEVEIASDTQLFDHFNILQNFLILSLNLRLKVRMVWKMIKFKGHY